jgi:threonine dehydrogenase-like Zn-dependent dehydrogenase
MRAVVCQNAELEVRDVPEPVPARGHVRVEVRRCGICGSDLHARHGIDAWAELAAPGGYHRFARSHQPVVFGHEFCGEVVEHGPGTRRATPTGTLVVALPLLRGAQGVDTVGLSMHAPGAYAEQLLVQEALMMPVPNGLRPEVAALTEPLAVAWHAVRRADIGKRTVAIVIGCGPVGLGVILMLKAKGVRTVVASDYSAGRRALASACGADILGAGAKHPVIFECVGVPGVIDSIIDGAPLFSRVVVVGVCVGPDRITPAMAINKEIDLRFVFAYSPLEFRDTLHMLAEGKVDPSPLVTGTVGLDGVEAAFDALGDPETHAKILIDPRSAAVQA